MKSKAGRVWGSYPKNQNWGSGLLVFRLDVCSTSRGCLKMVVPRLYCQGSWYLMAKGCMAYSIPTHLSWAISDQQIIWRQVRLRALTCSDSHLVHFFCFQPLTSPGWQCKELRWRRKGLDTEHFGGRIWPSFPLAVAWYSTHRRIQAYLLYTSPLGKCNVIKFQLGAPCVRNYWIQLLMSSIGKISTKHY